ncbi:uncharacterized protein F5Z01DRAFT_631969 [Emericellopsis atlantica]|uniref:Uncharacterized protein n=1 Tax=Emericellopsis atlantica TaxID=2614577 RepID=A0A9P7ZV14_9HYPO|nr:uncharacterized protein F5Z01DRAFT_631969 [Emericellopsis atlantica]KAG9258874.1 hypothetical protein F5Z01DRAFT_631969 [Emericellopsis atlantica]
MPSPKQQQQLQLDSKWGRNDLTPHLRKPTSDFFPGHVDVWEQFGGDEHHLQHNQAPKQRKASVAWSEDFASGLGTDYDNFSVPPFSSPKPGYDNLPDTIPLNDTLQGYVGQLPTVDFSETASVFTARRSSPAGEDGEGDEEFLIEDNIGNLATLAEGLVDPYSLPKDPKQPTADPESTTIDPKCSHKQGSHQEEFEHLLSDAAWEEIPALKIVKSSKADDSNFDTVELGQSESRAQALEDRISCSGEGDRANNPGQSKAVVQVDGKEKHHRQLRSSGLEVADSSVQNSEPRRASPEAAQLPQKHCSQDIKMKTTPEQIDSPPEMKSGNLSSIKRKQRPKPPLQFNNASQVTAGQPQAKPSKPPVKDVSRHRASKLRHRADSPVAGQGTNPADSKPLKKPRAKEAKSSTTTSRRKGPKMVGKSASVKETVKVKDTLVLKADSEASKESSHVPELPPTLLPEPQHNDMLPPSIDTPQTNVRTRGQAAAEATRTQHDAAAEQAVAVTVDTTHTTAGGKRSAEAIESPPETLSSPMIEDTYADNQILSDPASPTDSPAVPNPIEVPSVPAVVVAEKTKTETAQDDGPNPTEITTAKQLPAEKDGKSVFEDVIAIESDTASDSVVSHDDDQSLSLETKNAKPQASCQEIKLHDEHHDGDNSVREVRHDAETGSFLCEDSTTLVQTRITPDNPRPQRRKVYHQSTGDQTAKAGLNTKQHVESTGITFPTLRKRINEQQMVTTKDISKQLLAPDPGAKAVKSPNNFREFASARVRQGNVDAEKPFVKPKNMLPLVQHEETAQKNLRPLRNKIFEESSLRQVRQLPRLKSRSVSINEDGSPRPLLQPGDIRVAQVDYDHGRGEDDMGTDSLPTRRRSSKRLLFHKSTKSGQAPVGLVGKSKPAVVGIVGDESSGSHLARGLKRKGPCTDDARPLKKTLQQNLEGVYLRKPRSTTSADGGECTDEEQTLVNTPGTEIAHQLHSVVKLLTTRLDSAAKAVDEVIDAYDKGTLNCLDRIDQRITKEFEALGHEWESDARTFSRVAKDRKATVVSGNQSRRDTAGFFKSVSGDRQQLYAQATQTLRSFQRQILEG